MGGLLQFGRRDQVRTLRDRLREESSRVGRSHEVHDAEAARRFAGNRHVRSIAAKGADIALNPAQRLDLVEHSVIAGYPERRLGAELRMRQVAEYAEPIVDRNHDDASRSQPCAVIERLAARARREGPAVDPDEHRRLACVSRSPDVERQAVLARGPEFFRVDARDARFRLRAGGPELRRDPDIRPARQRARWSPAGRPHRRRRIRNALEDAQRAFGAALDPAGGCVCDRVACGVRWS